MEIDACTTCTYMAHRRFTNDRSKGPSTDTRHRIQPFIWNLSARRLFTVNLSGILTTEAHRCGDSGRPADRPPLIYKPRRRRRRQYLVTLQCAHDPKSVVEACESGGRSSGNCRDYRKGQSNCDREAAETGNGRTPMRLRRPSMKLSSVCDQLQSIYYTHTTRHCDVSSQTERRFLAETA